MRIERGCFSQNDWIVRNLADLQSDAPSADGEQMAAHRRLLSDLAEHAMLLATIGEQHGYPPQTVARAASAAAAAQDV